VTSPFLGASLSSLLARSEIIRFLCLIRYLIIRFSNSPLSFETSNTYSGLQLYRGQAWRSISTMKPYSLDLREKILRAYDEHRGSQRALAALFGVSRAFVEKLVQRRRGTGQIAPRPHAGGRKPSCDPAALAVVRQILQEQTDATLAELCEQLGQRRGLWVSLATMSRLLTRLGLPRKKRRSTPPNGTRRGSSRRGQMTGRSSKRSTRGA
jgi:transposase